MAFGPRPQEAEAGSSLSSKPAWSTQQIPGQPGLTWRYLDSYKTKLA